jgi:glyceraldehyde-3-phosphate dehydrogenase (NADP+)
VEAFAKALPPGAMNFVSGRGRETMPPLMRTGDIDGLAFIGGSRAADDLIKQHPRPHRLKVFLQLEAKNMGIFLPSIFDSKDEMAMALDQAMLGALSFNGQRCTALKLFFVPQKQGSAFATMMAKRVEEMTVGLPWQNWSSDETKSPSYSKITPLPDRKKVEYMQKLIQDAVSKGAKIMNENGGEVIGGSKSSLMVPAVVYPVTPDMDLYYEEQFGPIIPIATYDSLDTILDYGHNGAFGQQVSIFSSESNSDDISMLVDQFSSVFGKININSQCGRSPDTIPFSGRRSSAMGVMSVEHALQEFSIPTVVAYKESPSTAKLVKKVESTSKFFEAL